ncbi:MAG: hypothetical protein LBJ24_01770 [Treponema sp.]|jgi:hypothetical protein|nr:hypothetical protein [Treponema sp.]
MKLESGMTDVVGLPIDEADRIMDGMEQAEKAGDLEALRWCARMTQWLWDQAEINSTDTYCYSEILFNAAWNHLVNTDPPPASIAAIVAPKEKGPDGKAAGRALDTLQAFFEKTVAGKKLPAVLQSLESLRDTVTEFAWEEAE